ncbi:MAG: hypothetical protein ACRC2T_16310 [Thermoguttaceae bacterium]
MDSSGEPTLHVDVPLKKMQEILNQHSCNPSLDFDTHPGMTDDSTEACESSGDTILRKT